MKQLIEAKKKSAFEKDYKATDQEALGMLVSQFLEWDGRKILEVAAYALEDANFRGEESVVRELIKKLQ